MAFTLVYAFFSTAPVTLIGRGGLADGGGISELQVPSTSKSLGVRPVRVSLVILCSSSPLVARGRSQKSNLSFCVAHFWGWPWLRHQQETERSVAILYQI